MYYIPDQPTEKILFTKPIDIHQLENIIEGAAWGVGEFNEIHWLNTPGPIYTTYTDNCGTGQMEAIHNVGGDEDYHEVIFKQPMNRQELIETARAAAVDPFCAYYMDGNDYWDTSKIISWWNKSQERIDYILTRYKEELHLTPEMLNPVLGPSRPVPENYKYWLNFYQFGMKAYLEWYIRKLSSETTLLPPLDYDWTKVAAYDQLFAQSPFGKNQDSFQ